MEEEEILVSDTCTWIKFWQLPIVKTLYSSVASEQCVLGNYTEQHIFNGYHKTLSF